MIARRMWSDTRRGIIASISLGAKLDASTTTPGSASAGGGNKKGVFQNGIEPGAARKVYVGLAVGI